MAAVGWLVLAGVTDSRTNDSKYSLRNDVGELWGSAQTQAAPSFTLKWTEEVVSSQDITDSLGRVVSTKVDRRQETRSRSVEPASTDIAVNLRLDERRRGLLWFPLYDVDFAGTWTYTHLDPESRWLQLDFVLPDRNALYDNFVVSVDGADLGADGHPVEGVVTRMIPVVFGQQVTLGVRYTSRGADSWTYKPSSGVGQIEQFALRMTTDFEEVDFPVPGLSPTGKTERPGGWDLEWNFTRAVTGFPLGMILPTHIQPGELATSLSVSAPLSLGLFFLWIFALGLLRGTQVHPVNYLFIAGAFFSFNLLFAYTADLLPVEWAFALSAAVSVLLVVSYLRLVVGSRFALVEAGLAQLVYQVGFGVAHFRDGTTGLTITVLGIGTLFALMQLTGRVDWTAALSRKAGREGEGGLPR
jgi:transposase